MSLIEKEIAFHRKETEIQLNALKYLKAKWQIDDDEYYRKKQDIICWLKHTISKILLNPNK